MTPRPAGSSIKTRGPAPPRFRTKGAAAGPRAHAADLPAEAQAVLDAARPLYQFFYAHLPEINTTHFRIGTWDAGWWQVRNALAGQDLAPDLLAEAKRRHAALGQWLLPRLAALGFLP